ncbi:MAG TPA: HAMP domain-containing sensor histidine kinase [Acidimicrobiia bacterium]|nr:HAMP domain-containing sensor histidine kinase [Acidimicrobiia bacterium]
MGTERPIGPTSRRRAIGVAIGATSILVVLVVALAFANSVGAARVADNAQDLHWANASLGTAALTRAALVQATTFSELASSDLVTEDDLDAALGEAGDARQRLAELRDDAGESSSLAALTHFLFRVDETMAALNERNFDGAKNVLMTDAERAYIDLVDSLQAEQTVIQSQIEGNTAGSRRTTEFIRFFLMLAIPASAVLIYRSIARRQLREHRLQVDLELEKEREIGRAKDDFIAGLSHELRTPLTSIYGFAEILTDGAASDLSTSVELAQIIANEAAEMTRMVDDLLAAARLESTGVEVELSPTRVADVVESALLPFQRAGLTVKSAGGDALVATDAARLRHVLINLVSNAARHGGPNIGIEVSSGDDVVDIEVWDDGAGVPDDRLEKLFDTFIHNGAATLMTGTLGLGLGVASRLAALLGGKLVYQRFAQKSYFIVSLPLLAGSPDSSEDTTDEMGVADVTRAMSA